MGAPPTGPPSPRGRRAPRRGGRAARIHVRDRLSQARLHHRHRLRDGDRRRDGERRPARPQPRPARLAGVAARPPPGPGDRELRGRRDAARLRAALPPADPVAQRSKPPRLTPPIAVAAPLAVTPEQAAVWVAPQPDWSDETIAFAMVGALLGR